MKVSEICLPSAATVFMKHLANNVEYYIGNCLYKLGLSLL